MYPGDVGALGVADQIMDLVAFPVEPLAEGHNVLLNAISLVEAVV
jgi:hypothetical protein